MSAPVKTLGEFEADLAAINVRGQWQFEEALEAAKAGPQNGGLPYLWKWSDISEKLVEACRVMPDSFTARRNLAFLNPGLPKPGSTQTILTGIQMVMPGEVAWAHRHSMGALRFIIEGSRQAYTVVDGEVLPMEPNDLVLTPSWTWHDHHNESDRNAIWLDVLDAPLVFGLNQTFYQPFGDSVQPIRGEGEPAGRPVPYRYAWSDVEVSLRTYARTAGPHPDGIVLEYVHPFTGGPALPTLGCYMQLLPAGFATRERQQTSSAVYHVVAGYGETIVNGETVSWGPRDTFTVPTWAKHRHRSSGAGEAILFSVTDTPIVKALGLYREAGNQGEEVAPFPVVPAELVR